MVKKTENHHTALDQDSKYFFVETANEYKDFELTAINFNKSGLIVMVQS